MPKYTIRTSDGLIGPLDESEVKRLAVSGKLSPSDQVQLSNGSEWRNASEIKGFVPPASASGKRPLEHNPHNSGSHLKIAFLGVACTLATGTLVWAAIVLYNSFTSYPPTKEQAASTTAAPKERGQRTDDAIHTTDESASVAYSGIHGEAIADLENAVTVNPDDVDARLDYAAALIDEEQFEDAIEQIGSALESEPDNVAAWIALGNAALSKGGSNAPTVAMAAWEKAYQLDPANDTIALKLLLVYEKGNMTDRLIATAEKYLSKFIADRPTMKEPSEIQSAAMNSLASAYRVEGRYEDSFRVYQRILEYTPTNRSARMGVAKTHLVAGNPSSALDVLQRIEEHDADSLFVKAKAAYADGDMRIASRALEDSLALDSSTPQPWLYMALIE